MKILEGTRFVKLEDVGEGNKIKYTLELKAKVALQVDTLMK